MMRPSSACLFLLAAVVASPVRSQPSRAGAAADGTADPSLLCRAAIAVVEREASLPPRLLAAIARVEFGRRDPVSGTVQPWPWAINAEGRGSFFPTREAAIAAVRQLQAQGMRSIDVGCMQINLRHHPDAFPSLEQAFDPLANARYGARFLTELQATRGDWMRTAGHYHSQTPEFAEAYRARVVTALAAEQGAPAGAIPLAAPRPPVALPFAAGAGGGFLLSNRMERAAILPAPAGPGLAGTGGGRGLDAYRMLPIPVAGRSAFPVLARRL